jgi:DinB family protein
VSPGEVADLLEASGRAFASTLDGVTPEMASWHPAKGEWCINEVVGHIIEAETRGFAGRIRLLIASDEPPLADWDSASVSKERRDCEKPPAELRDDLVTLRKASVELVRDLHPDQMQRGGSHPRAGRLTLEDLIHEWVHHDGNHLRQALANVQAYMWPSMGNARRFSQISQ